MTSFTEASKGRDRVREFVQTNLVLSEVRLPSSLSFAFLRMFTRLRRFAQHCLDIYLLPIRENVFNKDEKQKTKQPSLIVIPLTTYLPVTMQNAEDTDPLSFVVRER